MESVLKQRGAHIKMARLFVCFAVLWCFLAEPTFVHSLHAQDRTEGRNTVKIFLGSFGSGADAQYVRNKLKSRLAKSRQVVIVDNPSAANFVLSGEATIRFAGRSCSNLRAHFLNRNCVAVYDARMTVRLEDSGGHPLWIAQLKPRYWGSQYVADNVANQAARHVVEVLQQRRDERNPSPDC